MAKNNKDRHVSLWKWSLASNGWADWTCPNCRYVYNDDIHVTLNYVYCPMCGKKLIVWEWEVES